MNVTRTVTSSVTLGRAEIIAALKAAYPDHIEVQAFDPERVTIRSGPSVVEGLTFTQVREASIPVPRPPEHPDGA